jgi:hypothetical protein
MDPSDGQLAATGVLALSMLAFTTALHYEGLEFLSRTAKGRDVSLRWVVRFLIAIVCLHLTEVALYAVTYAIGVNVFGLGALRGSSGKALDFFYFAAETYSTVGYGDLVPVGALRLLASVEPLNGLLLVAWSGAFLYGVLEDGKRPEL